jgi:uncharacterized phosphosugar-binding protein
MNQHSERSLGSAPYAPPPPIGGGPVCALSTVSGAPTARPVTVGTVRRMEAAGQVPASYLSADVPGGDEHNHTLESRYAGCIRRAA